MSIKTADLCDQYETELQVAEPVFLDYGGKRSFWGEIATVKVNEDNVLVRQALEQPGEERVLVVDGGGSLRCALLGGILGELAYRNGWAGVLIYGCVRDTEELRQVPIGIRALNANPLRSKKDGTGERDVPLAFAGVAFVPGHYLYADEDGIVVSPQELALG